jgi:hypothetical protein
VGERGRRTTESQVGVAQGLYRPGPMRVPYWDRCDDDAVAGRETATDRTAPSGGGSDEPNAGTDTDHSAA